MPGYYQMGQPIGPINKLGPQDILFFGEKKMDLNMHTRNYVRYTPPRKPFILVVNIIFQLQLLGVFLKKEGKLVVVAYNIGHVFPSGLDLQRYMTQNNKLIIHIA